MRCHNLYSFCGIISGYKLVVNESFNSLHTFCPLLIFKKINFLGEKFRKTIRVSISLYPDQARHFVGPDLGLNCLQRSSEDNTRQRVNGFQIKNGLRIFKVYVEQLFLEIPS